jgi:anti-sigma-K factor RskA
MTLSESSAELRAQKRPLLKDLPFLAGIVAAGLVVALALGGLMLAVRSTGDRQQSFVSHEVLFGDPGGRVYFYPKRQAAILKAWSLLNLEPARAYQVWAVEDGKPRSLALSQSSGILELDLFLHADLSRAESVIVTAEPARGSTIPSGSPLLVMSR